MRSINTFKEGVRPRRWKWVLYLSGTPYLQGAQGSSMIWESMRRCPSLALRGRVCRLLDRRGDGCQCDRYALLSGEVIVGKNPDEKLVWMLEELIWRFGLNVFSVDMFCVSIELICTVISPQIWSQSTAVQSSTMDLPISQTETIVQCLP